MTLGLTKPGGWGVNQKFRSSEATALDENTAKALDRTTAGDTLLGVVTLANTAALVLDTGSSMSLNIASSIVCHLGSYVTMEPGSAIGFDSGSSLTIGGSDRIILAARPRTSPTTDSGISTCDTTTQLPHFGITSTGWVQQGIELVAAACIHWRLRAVPGMTGITVTLGINGASHFALPATKPRLSIFRHTIGSILETPTEVAATDDTAGSVDAYSVARNLVCSLSAVDTTQYHYSIRLKGESGANSIIGGLLCNRVPIVDATYSRIAEEF